MSIKSQALIVLLSFSNLAALAQDSTMFIVFEGGTDLMGCKPVEKNYLRAERAAVEIFDPRIVSELHKTFVGIKFEKKNSNQRFAGATGLRFTQLMSTISKAGLPAYLSY